MVKDKKDSRQVYDPYGGNDKNCDTKNGEPNHKSLRIIIYTYKAFCNKISSLAFNLDLHSPHCMIKFCMKRILMTGLSILLFGTLFVMLRNGSEIDGDLRIKSSSFIDGLRILHEKNGINLWTLNAKRADFTDGGDKAHLSDINLVIQKEGIILYADKGIYDLTEQRFTTEGIVKAETKDYTITADSIDYEASSGEIKTGGRIKFEGKSFRVEGRGMKADAGQKVSVLNDVKATFNK